MANMMYDAQAPRSTYDRLNSTITQGNTAFYSAATVWHCTSLAFMSFFFRYRRIGGAATFAIAGAYSVYFQMTNDALYKIFVDMNVLREAGISGYNHLAQPHGTHIPRNITYK